MKCAFINIATGLLVVVWSTSAFAAEGEPPASAEVTAALLPYLDE